MMKNGSSGGGGVLLTVMAAGAAVACCAGPALLAGAGVGLAGGVLGMPLLLVIAALIVAGAVAFTVLRVRRGRRRAGKTVGDQQQAESVGADDCCSFELPPRPTSARTSAQTPTWTSSDGGRGRR